MTNEKPIIITEHAEERMRRYKISREIVISCIRKPDEVVSSYGGRLIAHKFRGRYVLRVVYEEDTLITVITVYWARRERYAGKAKV